MREKILPADLFKNCKLFKFCILKHNNSCLRDWWFHQKITVNFEKSSFKNALQTLYPPSLPHPFTLFFLQNESECFLASNVHFNPQQWMLDAEEHLNCYTPHGEFVCAYLFSCIRSIFGEKWLMNSLMKETFIFSLFNTVCRTLGIPARTVTNYQSAHDTHKS